MEPIQIAPGVYNVGVADWNIRDFHGYSTDLGTTWTRSQTSVEDGNIQTDARYPSMTLVNSTGSTDMGDVWAAFSWPELNPSAFGWLGYGVSIGLQTSAYAAIDQGPPAYSSRVPLLIIVIFIGFLTIKMTIH